MTLPQYPIDDILQENGLSVLKEKFDFKQQLPGGKFKNLDFRVRRKEDGADLALLIFASRWLGSINKHYILRNYLQRKHHLLTDEEEMRKACALTDDFALEAQLLRDLPEHPNLVTFKGFGVFPQPYLLSQWIDGHRLDTIHRTPEEALVDIYHMTRGIGVMHGIREYGHATPIIHNDIKIGNAMLCLSGPHAGYVKDMDLNTSQEGKGMVKARRLASTRNRAPESYRHKDNSGNPTGGMISTASDIYCLGTEAIAHVFDHYLWNIFEPFQDPRTSARVFRQYWHDLDHYSKEFKMYDGMIEERKNRPGPPLTDEKRKELAAMLNSSDHPTRGDDCLDLFLRMVSYKPEDRPDILKVVKRLEHILYGVNYDRARHESSWDFTYDPRYLSALIVDRDRRIANGESCYYRDWRTHQLYQFEAIRSFGDLIMMLRDGNPNVKMFACERIVMPLYPLLDPGQRKYVRNQVEHHLCNQYGCVPDLASTGSQSNEDEIWSVRDSAIQLLEEIKEYDAQHP